MISSWIKRLQRKIKLRQYDDFTISKYFRKQGAQIGKNNRILIRSLGESPRLISIGDHCTISSEVAMLTHDGAGWIFTNEIPSLQRFGTITILDNCFIGAQAMLLPDVRIGPNAVVGARAVVTKDVAPGTIVAGNPARVISTIDALKKKMIHLWNKQKPQGYLADLHDGTIYHPKTIQQAKQRDKEMLEKHLARLFSIKQHDS